MARGRNHIGSYRLLKLVRAGASCQVWEVIHELDNRRCALKVLQQEFWNNRDEVGLLKHEFTVGQELHHPNVIEVYEFDVIREVPFLALEYFESSNLKQCQRQREDLADHAVEVVEQAAEGLAYLHEQGWVHRDVKPDNFLVNDHWKVKLIDFAIAQKIRRGLGRLFSGRSKVQGTRSYMSPEQIRGEALDARSDVYSFGCMVFELYCGRPPFTGGNADELLQKHLKAPVPPLLANSEHANSELSALIGRTMAKQREERPEDMKAFLEEFRNLRMYRIRR